ncbi:MAG: hypothetical protein V8S96_01710 [Lachnospiraceae bacterium]
MQKESLCTGQLLCRDKDTGGYDGQAVIRQEAVQAETMLSGICRKRRVLAGKKLVAAVILRFLFQGLAVLARKEERMQEEVESWEPGFTWGICRSETGPALYMEWTGECLNRLAGADRPARS